MRFSANSSHDGQRARKLDSAWREQFVKKTDLDLPQKVSSAGTIGTRAGYHFQYQNVNDWKRVTLNLASSALESISQLHDLPWIDVQRSSPLHRVVHRTKLFHQALPSLPGRQLKLHFSWLNSSAW